MVFSTNQVRHLYVVNDFKTPKVLATDKTGDISVSNDKAKTHLYFNYKGVNGLMRSDLIDTKNIISVKATDASSMSRELKAFTVTLDNTVNSGNPIAGQDYILRIAFRQYIGMSDEDQYYKYGMVHAYSGMSVSDFYKTLALSLVKNFSREQAQLVKFTLTNNSDTAVPVDVTTKADSLNETYKALVINEVEQEWTRGIKACVPVYFTVQPTTVRFNSDDRIWGVVEETDPAGVVENGKTIADLEYFCMGERGDIYRNIAWPHSIQTTYLVDPNMKYNMIDIHYSWIGDNENVQKSEKTLSLAVPKVGATNSVSNVLTNKIIAAINTATGLSIATLDTSASA